jgi:predicted O-linked N-acetylglucosamine transferase (SPINDLY family)
MRGPSSTAVPSQATPDTVEALLARGLQQRKAGQIAAAIDSYMQVLAFEPDHPYALHLLGEIAHRAGKDERAVELIERAVAKLPTLAEAYNNLGAAYQALGRLGEAEAAYRRAIELKPSLIVAGNNLGTVLRAQGNVIEARRQLERVLTLEPRSPEACINLGNLLRESGELAAAEDCYRIVTEECPDNAPGWNNLGILQIDMRRYEDACVSLQRAIELDPHSAEAHNNLGNALRELGRHDESLLSFERALLIRPHFAQALNNAGVALSERSRYVEAAQYFRRAVDCDPEYVDAFLNLGASLRFCEELTEAIACFDRALELEPDNKKGHNYRGLTLLEVGRVDDGLAALRRALELDAGYARARSNYLFGLNYDPKLTGPAMLVEHRVFDEPFRAAAPRDFANVRDPERRLRVAYISPDFKRHSCAFFIEPLVAAHDPREVEVYCYSDVHLPDAVTERIRQHVPQWRDTSKLRDREFIHAVLDDRIDIAVDLTGHTGNNRLCALGSLLAPIQISWLGYPCTTGMSAIGYRITDGIADPAGATDAHHSETLIRLPRTFLCYRPPDEAPAPGPLPSRAGSPFTFGSFNNLPKVNDTVIAAWSAILHRVPGSRLLLKSRALASAEPAERVRQAFAARGIDGARIELVGWVRDPAGHLKLYDRIDLALDPFPYNGTTTTCEAMWMGVPVLTLAGDRHAARVGASLLTQVGLERLIAGTPEDYIARAAALAADRDTLAAIRGSLRGRMAASPLCDAAAFARDMEAAYRAVWRDWCAKG